MKGFVKILFSSTIVIIIFIMSSFSALGGPGNGMIEPYSIKLDEKY
ncbi:hypothetical protein [Bacillus horti]|uniref:Uncharacterized protein n=1 Tax=Caldalkalibacillus horti TaxID=77523 RepID=A0ABT9W5M8_9BACI|nr:hypothetical protein [Bacillus horti]MDQ0168377.1 hypothetical protein [Bacillus horti]